MDLWKKNNCRCALLLEESSPEKLLRGMLWRPLEGLTPFQLRMHALALSSIVEVRKILFRQENMKKMPEFKGLASCPYCSDAMPTRKGATDKFYCPSCGKTFTAKADTILHH